ncbi:Hsp20/alpha crystallin family protein [Actinomadura sp. HBU206391]|uniref:Hsp20/alpha crystallin family protein n=1 Tax=Actinomadura sp. HBU206391 TaxID=2731692 RepID=UPI00164FD09E|nr:Hsp20/alpha crystallin family protein [Actinomadura sp. HBU206391]MBC6458945.1 Hsp20/alpha crystallin family protein [Actinomadura sp. HBU206391]
MHGVEPTAILRREPFADMQELLNRIGGLVQPAAETVMERPWMPIAETDETDDAYVVRLELPGIAPDEIEIGIRDRDLCVNGEVREEEEGSNALRVRMGRFHYHTSLPSDVDADNVEASMDEGILTLRIPKAQESRGRRIEIKGGRSEGGRSERGGRSRGSRNQGTPSS